MHGHGVVVTRLVHICDFMPFIFRDVIDLALLARLVRVLATNRIDVVLGLEVELAVQVNNLVATARVMHGCPRLDFVLVLIDDEALPAEYAADLVFLLFSAKEEDLILCLH